MARTPQRPGWSRFIAPTILLPTLGVALLPVLEAGTEGSPKAFEVTNQLRQAMGQKKVGESGKFVTVTQNGYQAVWGSYSDGPEIAEEKREAERRGKEWMRDHPEEVEKLKQLGQEMQKWAKENGFDKQQAKEEPPPAPLLGVYFGFVVLGVLLGYVLPPGRLRSGIFAGMVLVAAALLGAQTYIGLPLYKKTEKEIRSAADLVDKSNKVAHAVGVKVEAPRPYLRYTPWLYSPWPLLLLPIGVVVLEEGAALLAGFAGKKKSKRRDEEDEEDDRPRRRRRREDDGDEEEKRPRRQRF
jgi:hypothetical protein